MKLLLAIFAFSLFAPAAHAECDMYEAIRKTVDESIAQQNRRVTRIDKVIALSDVRDEVHFHFEAKEHGRTYESTDSVVLFEESARTCKYKVIIDW